jgi:ATP-dependent RNA helicase DDX51/DBP6
LHVAAGSDTAIPAGTDVLVSTPGRLLALLPNLTLEHLRVLVVDEADRVLARASGPDAWLPRVLAALRPASGAPDAGIHAPAWAPRSVQSDLDERRAGACQVLLFSATLTADPAQLGALGLRAPRFFVVAKPDADDAMDVDEDAREHVLGRALEGVALERFAMPAGLQVCAFGVGRKGRR